MTPEFPAQPATLTAAQLKAEANRLGFSACAITSLEPLPHNEELDRWLASGKAGNMRYLHRQAKKRKNPQVADKTARRAIVVLDSYYYESIEETTRPKVARYAGEPTTTPSPVGDWSYWQIFSAIMALRRPVPTPTQARWPNGNSRNGPG